MVDTENAPPHTNGIGDDGLDDDDRTKIRPADIDADVREMERRKRVEMVMNSRLFREELERIIDLQMKDGNTSGNLLQSISDMMGLQGQRLQSAHLFRGSTCVAPINDIRGVESMGYAKGEKILRCKVSAVYRLMDLYGWTQNIQNHITARLNVDEEIFLVNPHGLLYNEITASSLVKVDMRGDVIESGTTNFGVNTSTFALHAAIHAARPDLKAIVHVTTPAAVAVSSLKCGLLPLSREAVVLGELSVHPFTGYNKSEEEKEKIVRSLGPNNKVMFLTNNGAVCCGETVEEAFYNVYNLVAACESQLKLMPAGVDNLLLIPDDVRKEIYDSSRICPEGAIPAHTNGPTPAVLEKKEKRWRIGGMEFEALMRMLDNAGFRTGYIYRTPLIKGDPPRPRNDIEVPPAVSSLGYLLEEEEMYKNGWKGRKSNDRSRWLNSPNVYQKVEILETGTTDPRKITKWVADGSPTHSSTPVKIESALQFVPKNTNPKEFKKLQQQIKENRRADKITSGPQSQLLEGVSWEEAKKLQDANMSATGDQVILVGAASKGIIQRGFQHNATVYKTPYAKNPFDQMTDQEIEEYKSTVSRKQRGETEDEYSESEPLSYARGKPGTFSETEDESRDEPRVLRINNKQVPKASQPEVVLSDDHACTRSLPYNLKSSSSYSSTRSFSSLYLNTPSTLSYRSQPVDQPKLVTAQVSVLPEPKRAILVSVGEKDVRRNSLNSLEDLCRPHTVPPRRRYSDIIKKKYYFLTSKPRRSIDTRLMKRSTDAKTINSIITKVLLHLNDIRYSQSLRFPRVLDAAHSPCSFVVPPSSCSYWHSADSTLTNNISCCTEFEKHEKSTQTLQQPFAKSALNASELPRIESPYRRQFEDVIRQMRSGNMDKPHIYAGGDGKHLNQPSPVPIPSTSSLAIMQPESRNLLMKSIRKLTFDSEDNNSDASVLIPEESTSVPLPQDVKKKSAPSETTPVLETFLDELKQKLHSPNKGLTQSPTKKFTVAPELRRYLDRKESMPHEEEMTSFMSPGTESSDTDGFPYNEPNLSPFNEPLSVYIPPEKSLLDSTASALSMSKNNPFLSQNYLSPIYEVSCEEGCGLSEQFVRKIEKYTYGHVHSSGSIDDVSSVECSQVTQIEAIPELSSVLVIPDKHEDQPGRQDLVLMKTNGQSCFEGLIENLNQDLAVKDYSKEAVVDLAAQSPRTIECDDSVDNINDHIFVAQEQNASFVDHVEEQTQHSESRDKTRKNSLSEQDFSSRADTHTGDSDIQICFDGPVLEKDSLQNEAKEVTEKIFGQGIKSPITIDENPKKGRQSSKTVMAPVVTNPAKRMHYNLTQTPPASPKYSKLDRLDKCPSFINWELPEVSKKSLQTPQSLKKGTTLSLRKTQSCRAPCVETEVNVRKKLNQSLESSPMSTRGVRETDCLSTTPSDQVARTKPFSLSKDRSAPKAQRFRSDTSSPSANNGKLSSKRTLFHIKNTNTGKKFERQCCKKDKAESVPWKLRNVTLRKRPLSKIETESRPKSAEKAIESPCSKRCASNKSKKPLEEPTTSRCEYDDVVNLEDQEKMQANENDTKNVNETDLKVCAQIEERVYDPQIDENHTQYAEDIPALGNQPRNVGDGEIDDQCVGQVDVQVHREKNDDDQNNEKVDAQDIKVNEDCDSTQNDENVDLDQKEKESSDSVPSSLFDSLEETHLKKAPKDESSEPNNSDSTTGLESINELIDSIEEDNNCTLYKTLDATELSQKDDSKNNCEKFENKQADSTLYKTLDTVGLSHVDALEGDGSAEERINNEHLINASGFHSKSVLEKKEEKVDDEYDHDTLYKTVDATGFSGIYPFDKDTEDMDDLDKSTECKDDLDKGTESMDALDKDIESMYALDEDIESMYALDKDIESMNALDKDIESTNALDKDIESMNALDKDIESMDALDKDIESVDALDKDIESMDTLDKDAESMEALDKDTEIMHGLDTESTDALYKNKDEVEGEDSSLYETFDQTGFSETNVVSEGSVEELIDESTNDPVYVTLDITGFSQTDAQGSVEDLIDESTTDPIYVTLDITGFSQNDVGNRPHDTFSDKLATKQDEHPENYTKYYVDSIVPINSGIADVVPLSLAKSIAQQNELDETALIDQVTEDHFGDKNDANEKEPSCNISSDECDEEVMNDEKEEMDEIEDKREDEVWEKQLDETFEDNIDDSEDLYHSFADNTLASNYSSLDVTEECDIFEHENVKIVDQFENLDDPEKMTKTSGEESDIQETPTRNTCPSKDFHGENSSSYATCRDESLHNSAQMISSPYQLCFFDKKEKAALNIKSNTDVNIVDSRLAIAVDSTHLDQSLCSSKMRISFDNLSSIHGDVRHSSSSSTKNTSDSTDSKQVPEENTEPPEFEIKTVDLDEIANKDDNDANKLEDEGAMINQHEKEHSGDDLHEMFELEKVSMAESNDFSCMLFEQILHNRFSPSVNELWGTSSIEQIDNVASYNFEVDSCEREFNLLTEKQYEDLVYFNEKLNRSLDSAVVRVTDSMTISRRQTF